MTADFGLHDEVRVHVLLWVHRAGSAPSPVHDELLLLFGHDRLLMIFARRASRTLRVAPAEFGFPSATRLTRDTTSVDRVRC